MPGSDCLHAQALSAWVRGDVPSSEVLAVLVLLGGIGGGLVGIGMKSFPNELLGDIRTVRVARVDEFAWPVSMKVTPISTARRSPATPRSLLRGRSD